MGKYRFLEIVQTLPKEDSKVKMVKQGANRHLLLQSTLFVSPIDTLLTIT